MSNELDRTETLQQRMRQATLELCSRLGLGNPSPTSLKYLTLALARAATEEASRNGDFAERVRFLYRSLLPVGTKRDTTVSERSGTSRSKTWKVSLTPVGTVDESLLDPYGPPNPFVLQQLYGDEQLALALGRYTPAKLREAIVLVQQKYPGTKPKKATKAGIIDYIVATITVQPVVQSTE